MKIQIVVEIKSRQLLPVFAGRVYFIWNFPVSSASIFHIARTEAKVDDAIFLNNVEWIIYSSVQLLYSHAHRITLGNKVFYLGWPVCTSDTHVALRNSQCRNYFVGCSGVSLRHQLSELGLHARPSCQNFYVRHYSGLGTIRYHNFS